MTSVNLYVVAFDLKLPPSLPTQSSAVVILYQIQQRLKNYAFHQTVFL